MTSLLHLEEEAQASRDRLSRSLQQLRRHLEPHHLVDEMFEAVAGPDGTSAVKQMEGVIRDYPLPMMLIGAGSVLWLTGGGRSSGPESSEKAAAKSVKENVLSMGQSVIDNACQSIEARLSAALNEYAETATVGVEKASDRVTHSLREVMDDTIDKISSSMRQHPLTSSVLVMAVSTALGGKAAKKSS
jgi:hypothetical protein